MKHIIHPCHIAALNTGTKTTKYLAPPRLQISPSACTLWLERFKYRTYGFIFIVVYQVTVIAVSTMIFNVFVSEDQKKGLK